MLYVWRIIYGQVNFLFSRRSLTFQLDDLPVTSIKQNIWKSCAENVPNLYYSCRDVRARARIPIRSAGCRRRAIFSKRPAAAGLGNDHVPHEDPRSHAEAVRKTATG